MKFSHFRKTTLALATGAIISVAWAQTSSPNTNTNTNSAPGSGSASTSESSSTSADTNASNSSLRLSGPTSSVTLGTPSESQGRTNANSVDYAACRNLSTQAEIQLCQARVRQNEPRNRAHDSDSRINSEVPPAQAR